MNIACPNCRRRLRVPDGAVGRRARCPECRGKFVVPRPDDQMFETVNGYILEDEPVARGQSETDEKL